MLVRRNSLLGAFAALLALLSGGTLAYAIAIAAACDTPQGLMQCDGQARFEVQVPRYVLGAVIHDRGRRGIDTALFGVSTRPAETRPQVPDAWRPGPAVATRTYLAPLICRRDDYPFLAPGAIGGQRCDQGQPGETIDPEQVARARFAGLELPSLTLNMNPRLGMVAIPTWFWVEGYDGGMLPLLSELAMPREECREVPELNADGEVILNRNGSPVTLRECTMVTDHMTVEVRVWPRIYHWEFGDTRDQTVFCPSIEACAAGLGRAYTDPRTPSPIRHAYGWSSLNVNGSADAYTIRLGITFGAQYRFSLNAAPLSGWQDLPDRELAWSAAHQVQEAQAVLTRGP